MRVGRRGLGTELLQAGVDTRKLSHRARRRIASPPMKQVERVVTAVGEAIAAWSARFIDAVMALVVPSIRQDASVEDVYESLTDPEVAKRMLDSVFQSVDKASSDDLRVVGVQTSTVVPKAAQLQAEWIRKSTDLIKATEDVRRRVERILSDPLTSGRSVDDIRKLLEEQAGYARSRAEFTARDQTLKLYGRIQEERQTAAGFTKYVWTTSLDERVREDHAKLDGTVQSWDDPPIVDTRTGRRGHPGFDFQCRCSAVPYADDGTDTIVQEVPREAAPEPRPDTEIQRAQQQAEARRAAEQAAEAQRQAEERAAARRAQVEADRLRNERELAEASAARARVAQLQAERAGAEASERLRAESTAVALRKVQFGKFGDVGAVQAAAAERGLAKAGFGKFFATRSIERVTFTTLKTPVGVEDTPESPRVRTSGAYWHGAKAEALKVNVDPEFMGRMTSRTVTEARPDLRGMQYGGTAEESIERTAVHEFGHAVHLHPDLVESSAADAVVEARWAALQKDFKNPDGTMNIHKWVDSRAEFMGEYAATNAQEYFAEAFTAYHYHFEWLKRTAPLAFKMVEDVMRIRGLK